MVYGNSGALSKFSLAIFVEIGTIFRQQDTPLHSFGGKIRIWSKSALNPLWRSLPFAVKGGFYLVGDTQKRVPLSESGFEVEPEECMGAVALGYSALPPSVFMVPPEKGQDKSDCGDKSSGVQTFQSRLLHTEGQCGV